MGSNYYLFQYFIDVKKIITVTKKLTAVILPMTLFYFPWKNISKITHFNLVQFMNVKENKDQSYDLPVL